MEEGNHSDKRKPASVVLAGRGRSVRRKTSVHHPCDVPIAADHGSTRQQEVVSESVLQQKTLIELKEMLRLCKLPVSGKKEFKYIPNMKHVQAATDEDEAFAHDCALHPRRTRF